MSRPACGVPTFTEHRYSKSPDLCTLILMRDQRNGLDLEPSGADSVHVSGCTPQLEFDAATSIATNGRIPFSEGLQAASGKEKF